MRYYIKTFGCQMNVHDSEFIEGILAKNEYESCSGLDDADLIIINTCCVRATAENKIYGFLDSLQRLKRANPSLAIAVIGCLVSNESAAKKVVQRGKIVDIVLGTRSLYRLPFYLGKLQEEKGPFVEIDLDADVPEGRIHRRPDDFRAFVTIMYGCDNFCSYCVVPYVRGREKSRRFKDILLEAEALAAEGAKEIMFLGQNVNSYGQGLEGAANFADLLRAANAIPGIERIRYMTSHPKDFNDEIIAAIAESPKVCRHFHLPAQSGSNHILKAMNRHYDREYYLDLLEKIKDRFPDATLTTDIIVGFPDETEDDFMDTIDLLNRVEYDLAYTFLYSPREGTPAAKKKQIPQTVKKERLIRLMEIQNEISLRKNRALIGKEVLILGEGESHSNPAFQTGRTEGNKIVNFPSERGMKGQMAKIHIMDAHTWSLEGRL